MALRSAGSSRAPMSPAGGRGWQVIRENFADFLVNQPPKRDISGAASAVSLFLGIMKTEEDTGPSKEQLRNAAQDRLLDNIISRLNKETPEGRLSDQQWTNAKNAQIEVRNTLQAIGYQRPESGDRGSLDSMLGTKHTSEACAALFPVDWCNLITVDLIADLVVDALMGSVVDSFLDGAVELLQIHEGWTLPSEDYRGSPRQAGSVMGKSMSSPLRLTATQASTSLTDGGGSQSMQLPGGPVPSSPQSPLLAPPSVPAIWRQQNRPFQSIESLSSGRLSHPRGRNQSSSLDGFATSPGRYSVRGGKGTGQEMDGWTLRRFHACQPLESYTKRIQATTEQQRPRRRLKRVESDPLAPKQSLPMLATNFPEYWEKTAPAPLPKPTITEVVGGPFAGDDAEEWDEEEPKGYTWLQRKGRDGQTVFPYSLVSHRAFIQSYNNDPVLKARAMDVAPIRFTDSW
eukprot:CAMPEP_0197651880 /NCGR_PEP_ID=MMETSP1338-20131121/34108_1 /TAXON_ID=43686 ORGANISM="Pelagodinium beii, Strain RCC1491" /NCGR_SAMPLE_ID=MMETSP1338 /ASSEMBLY_ACC=CAM_ASM_000754 /LENGTH=457 /DNA_ID=CAMNT_0043226637 /DNA_START=36 /DNA_END=1409 /DNA_ORIENTATION=-